MNKKIIILTMMLVFGMTLGHAEHFRSKTPGGVWSSKGTWQCSYLQWIWTLVPVPHAPSYDDNSILIKDPVDVDVDVTIDQTTIKDAGKLSINNSITLTIANGSGTDLTIEGTLTGDEIGRAHV